MVVLSAITSFLGILSISLPMHYGVLDDGFFMLIGSFGATAALVYAAPGEWAATVSARLSNVTLGHTHSDHHTASCIQHAQAGPLSLCMMISGSCSVSALRRPPIAAA
jgi:hypothetical protein